MLKARKIILDCDPGHDDAIALLMAAANPKIELVGVTTVAGNSTIEKTTLNAQKVCELAGIHVPIAQGASRPLVREQVTASSIHGESGLDGPSLPTPTKPLLEIDAVDFIIQTLSQSDEKITLVPVGPLTNIALAIRKEPKILDKIEEIVFMGGGRFGNWTPAAEFNIYVDAEAAQIVLDSGVPITMVGLDLTHQAIATKAIQQQIAQIDHKVARFVVELLEFFSETYKEVFGFEGAPIHDACCVAYCIDPDVFTTSHLRVDVETNGQFTYGMTVIDLHGVTKRAANVHVAMELNQDKFWSLMLDTLQNYR
ncbi:purine nucleosidase [Seinonella peptonophila]|uniref:Purine nucleosidase n=1 Tax=Seinonella peptonophila TaxID=112248 RepID=A0A1M5A6I6_9BACL|nr:nucleoside hydrolase [Seinonella peptonophila]SHF25636.1 purine nucleosidase [Seinonella peptonophila]